MVVDQKKQELRFLTITFVLVFFLGGASFVSVMSIPSPATRAQDLARNPASLPVPGDLAQPEPAHFSKLEDYQWDCKAKNQNSEIRATHFRIKGKTFCRGVAIRALKIKNVSNGFTATVFENEKGFLTDFIDLQPGANAIQIEYSDKQGKALTADLTILRQ